MNSTNQILTFEVWFFSLTLWMTNSWLKYSKVKTLHLYIPCPNVCIDESLKMNCWGCAIDKTFKNHGTRVDSTQCKFFQFSIFYIFFFWKNIPTANYTDSFLSLPPSLSPPSLSPLPPPSLPPLNPSLLTIVFGNFST